MTRWIARHGRLAGAAAIVIALLAGVAFAPWHAPQSFRDAGLRRLAAVFDAPNLAARDVRFVLLPTPRLSIAELSFSTSDGALSVKAEDARVSLELFTLLAGRARASGLALDAPDVRVRLSARAIDQQPTDPARLVEDIAKDVAKRTRGTLIQRVDIDRGRLTIEQGADGQRARYEDVRVRIKAPSPRHPIALSFRGRQGAEETQISFLGATPLRIFTGAREPTSFAIRTPNANLEFEGEGAFAGGIHLKGSVTGAATSTIAGLLAIAPARGAEGATRFSIAARLDLSPRSANLSDMRLGVNADRYDGVASIRHDGQRWHVAGTLATEKADISQFIAPLRRLMEPDGAWSAAAVDAEPFFSHNVDLRLSAEKLTVFGRTLERAAIALLSRPNKAEATLGDALWHKGVAKARLTASPGSFGLDLKLNASLERADLGSALFDLTGARRLTGLGTVTLALDTSGSAFAQFVANSEGRVAATLRGGEIVGIDLNRMANRRDGRRELALTEALGGRTAFETATLTTRIANGAAQPVDGHMRMGRLVGTVQGRVDFAQALHELTGSVVLSPAEPQAAEPTPVLDFSITGPLLEPRISPNVAALLRRS